MKTIQKWLSGFALVAALAVAFTPSTTNAQALNDYVEQKMTDLLLRGQAYTAPTSVCAHLYTADPTDATSGGTEVSGGSYAAACNTANLTNWSGTQGAGTTVASSGTGGASSNNIAFTFAAPTANWGTVSHMCLTDQTGNRLVCGALTTPKTINNNDAAPSFAIAAITVTLQ